MLILTRRTGETIIIGRNKEITVTVLGVVGNQVRFGINAAKEVPIHREEIYERIQRELAGGEGMKTLEEARPGYSPEKKPVEETVGKTHVIRGAKVTHSPRCDCQLCTGGDVTQAV